MKDVQEESFSSALRARAKRLVIIGAALLWVASPLLIGAWVTVAVRLADRGHVGAGLYVVMVVWALACLVVLLAGFAMLLGGVFFWWRSRVVAEGTARGRPRARESASTAARSQMLREMQQQLRDEHPGDEVGARVAGDAGAHAAAEDSEAPHPRR